MEFFLSYRNALIRLEHFGGTTTEGILNPGYVDHFESLPVTVNLLRANQYSIQYPSLHPALFFHGTD